MSQLHDTMKTVSFDDEAYRLLKGSKLPGESFSDVVKRLLGHRRDLGDSAGAWSGMTDEEVEALREETLDAFEGRGGSP